MVNDQDLLYVDDASGQERSSEPCDLWSRFIVFLW
jgi:hypothetical protein